MISKNPTILTPGASVTAISLDIESLNDTILTPIRKTEEVTSPRISELDLHSLQRSPLNPVEVAVAFRPTKCPDSVFQEALNYTYDHLKSRIINLRTAPASKLMK